MSMSMVDSFYKFVYHDLQEKYSTTSMVYIKHIVCNMTTLFLIYLEAFLGCSGDFFVDRKVSLGFLGVWISGKSSVVML